MKQEIDVVVKPYDIKRVQELMEDTIVQIVVDRINKYPKEKRMYIYDKIIEALENKES